MPSKLPQTLFILHLPKLIEHLIDGYQINTRYRKVKTTISPKSGPLGLLGLTPERALAFVKNFSPVATPYQDYPRWGSEKHWGRVHFLLTAEHEPIHLKVGETHLQITNGRHRLLAAWLTGKSTIQAYVEGHLNNPIIQIILLPLLAPDADPNC